ncbi:hypothetical protein PoB_004938800 [Plakobranchus ocellatus]|uniref:Uncharacterized protein n=1 Tax=Plakobranchus ocellatus TaxID=259542 RepID=A0AAV4BTF6_9GAST|nr:hypothetical protein PoB_004938800 [Plakobranchus ocellatus]
MTMIEEKYLQYLQSHYADFYNPSYQTYKLKAKLQKHFGERIQFWQLNYGSELAYSSELPKGAVVETAFEVASSDERRLQEAALVLRRVIRMEAENLTFAFIVCLRFGLQGIFM